MNIHDFQAAEFTPNWLDHIFEKQNALIVKYAEIEKMPSVPMSIHTREGQKWIKDFLWRVTEEMAESFEAFIMLGAETSNPETADHSKMEAHITHNIEELIDALHFLVELIIIAGKDAAWCRELLDNKNDGIEMNIEYPAQAYWAVTYYLGMVGNTLKNKPWKQTEMPTDEEKFYKNLGLAFKALFICFETMDADEAQVFSFYDRKNQVNQFRQRSNY